MEAYCPYCSHVVTSIYEAVANIHKKMGGAATRPAIALCLRCGEPMVFHGDEVRKPTDSEFEGLVNDEDYVRARAVWIEIDAREKAGKGAPVASMWKIYVRECGLDFASDKAEQRYRATFFSGVSMAVAYFKEAMRQEDHIFVGRMNLLEAELEAESQEHETFENIGEVMGRIVDALAGKARGRG